ncbi:unnamed protein product [Arctia plantaginis]|uniref:Dihydropteridine reductase n=1 Tax=Arctia plantaginis TaxID=874455 RepID=A0A8S0ZSS4_ARCPL|nr:unnamed protein product [Arctia plantaginis]
MTVKRIIVYGGRGNLGSTCVSHFKAANWWVGSIDYFKNEHADANVVIPKDLSWLEQEEHVMHELSGILDIKKINTVACVAGGWTPGNEVKSLSRHAVLTWKQFVWPSSIAASVAAKYLAPGGVLTFTGAQAALRGTPGMIGYGMAKAAVHQLTKSIGAKNFGLAQDSLVVAILPKVLDTHANRQLMPEANFSSWTPLSFVAELLLTWSKGIARPPSGSLVGLITKNNITTLVMEDELIRSVHPHKEDLEIDS